RPPRGGLPPEGLSPEAPDRLSAGRRRRGQGQVRARQHPQPPEWRRRPEYRGDRTGRLRARPQVVRRQDDRPRREAPAGNPPDTGNDLRRVRQHHEELQHHPSGASRRLEADPAGGRRADHGAPGCRVPVHAPLDRPAVGDSATHRMIRSAVWRREAGTTTPSALAVRLLTTSSEREGRSIGNPPGRAPLMTLAVYDPARRYIASRLGP